MSRKKKKIIKILLKIILFLILITIVVLFFMHKPKNKELIKYTENLLEIKLDKYVESNKGTIKKDKNNQETVNLKFEIKGFLINKLKKELDGKMDYYGLTSTMYVEDYKKEVEKYIGDMIVDSFYHLSKDGRSIMGILCEENGQYYFLVIG